MPNLELSCSRSRIDFVQLSETQLFNCKQFKELKKEELNCRSLQNVHFYYTSFAQPRLFGQLPCTFNTQTSLQVCGCVSRCQHLLRAICNISNSPFFQQKILATNVKVNLQIHCSTGAPISRRLGAIITVSLVILPG